MDEGRNHETGNGTRHATGINERIEKDDVHLWILREEHCSAAPPTTTATTTTTTYPCDDGDGDGDAREIPAAMPAPGVRGRPSGERAEAGACMGGRGRTGMPPSPNPCKVFPLHFRMQSVSVSAPSKMR